MALNTKKNELFSLSPETSSCNILTSILTTMNYEATVLSDNVAMQLNMARGPNFARVDPIVTGNNWYWTNLFDWTKFFVTIPDL